MSVSEKHFDGCIYIVYFTFKFQYIDISLCINVWFLKAKVMVDNLNHLLFTANVDTHIKVEIIIRLSFAPQTDEIKCVFQLTPM